MIFALIYTLISLCLQFNHFGEPKKASPKKAAKQELIKPHKKTKATKIGTLDHHIALMKVSFDTLPGWNKAKLRLSLLAFQKSCQTFSQQNPRHPVGSRQIKLKAGDWQPACRAALLCDPNSMGETRQFFEAWFHPIEFKEEKKHPPGLFTGYYMPSFEGSLTRTSEFSTPIYGLPKCFNKGQKKRMPYYTREQIDNGALKKKAPIIAWIKDPIDRLFLEIEGSGVIQLSSGQKVYLDYAGENGAPYTSISKVLIRRGIMNKHNASRKAIKRYLKRHPNKINPILHKNKSFVFFQRIKKPLPLGAQGARLTPGYSLAIDRKWIPLGAPLWLSSKKPNEYDEEQQFQRLMIAQDTGGAIKGLMRGDVYWGASEKAAFLGEHMKNDGRFWLLLPKYAVAKITHSIAT